MYEGLGRSAQDSGDRWSMGPGRPSFCAKADTLKFLARALRQETIKAPRLERKK